MTCAEHPFRQPKRALAHVKKKKQGNDVCGAFLSPLQEGGGTRQKGKARKMTCVEHPFRQPKRAEAHVKKEKQGCDVCGAAILPAQEGIGTRQKRKTI